MSPHPSAVGLETKPSVYAHPSAVDLETKPSVTSLPSAVVEAKPLPPPIALSATITLIADYPLESRQSLAALSIKTPC